ncbi:MAG TPA: hypothetical protein VLB73_02575 [Patescibacteria group bacterium]|nr:hypothetical protein [Patescibacteria group bacterium]
MEKISKLLLTVVSLMLLFAGVSFAASSLSVRLEQPKSPTNLNDFTITFVALDTQNNPVTVTCYKKGPSDGGYAQFDTIKNLSNGGGSDNCHATSSLVNQDGTYAFYVTASNGSTTVTSSIVTIDVNTSGPGTPTNYSKTQSDSCHFTISFRTADDSGKTSKVEIYRSSTTTLTADNNSRITSISVGSNTDRTYSDTIPSCGTTYFYALRAFDSAGNASGLVGDGELTATSTTTTNTTSGTTGNAAGVTGTGGGAIPVTTSDVTPGEGKTASGTPAPTEQQVLGATKAPIQSPLSSVGDFFHSYINWLLLIGLAVVVGIAIWYFRQKNS